MRISLREAVSGGSLRISGHFCGNGIEEKDGKGKANDPKEIHASHWLIPYGIFIARPVRLHHFKAIEPVVHLCQIFSQNRGSI